MSLDHAAETMKIDLHRAPVPSPDDEPFEADVPQPVPQEDPVPDPHPEADEVSRSRTRCT